MRSAGEIGRSREDYAQTIQEVGQGQFPGARSKFEGRRTKNVPKGSVVRPGRRARAEHIWRSFVEAPVDALGGQLVNLR